MQKPQRGITLIGFIMAAAMFCAFALVGLKVIPVYINHYYIVSSIKHLRTLDKQPLQQSPAMAIAYLKEYLSRKLYVNEIRFISRKDMKIKRTRKAYVVSVPYTIEKSLISNVSLVFKFDPSYEVPIK